jgi:hypothetical protein
VIEVDSENCLSDRLEETTDGVATKLGWKPVGDSTAPMDSFAVVIADQSDADFPRTTNVSVMRDRLEQYPVFEVGPLCSISNELKIRSSCRDASLPAT